MGGTEARELACALDGHGDFPRLEAAGHAVFIQQVDRHEGRAAPVCCEDLLVNADAERCGRARCAQSETPVFLAVGVADGQQLAGFIVQRKGSLMLLGGFAAQ